MFHIALVQQAFAGGRRTGVQSLDAAETQAEKGPASLHADATEWFR